MADEKVTSNGNVQVWVIPEADVADINAPTATEINTNGINITDSVAWEGTTWPANTESNDVDDRSVLDKGNATSRGFAQFEATLNFFRPKNVLDSQDEYNIAFQFFKTPRVPVILVTRVLQATEGVATPVAAGQWISVYRFITASVIDDTEGEDSYKYAVNFMPQGDLAVYTQVKNATAVTLAPLTLALDVGEHGVVRATLGGKRATQVVNWASSNTAVATVSPNGVVTGVSAGTANITATHPAATGSTTPCVVTVTNP
jgi:uncharacterized protein YjdB